MAKKADQKESKYLDKLLGLLILIATLMTGILYVSWDIIGTFSLCLLTLFYLVFAFTFILIVVGMFRKSDKIAKWSLILNCFLGVLFALFIIILIWQKTGAKVSIGIDFVKSNISENLNLNYSDS